MSLASTDSPSAAGFSSDQGRERLDLLRDRAEMLARVRAFFAQRGVWEVDVPALSMQASVDVYIDLVEATCLGQRAFLHSSPEYGMKRLLSEGAGDIYQLSHVFRNGERGERHNPEFTLIEWYRMAYSLEVMIEETLACISLFLEEMPSFETLSYREAFDRHAHRYPETQEERDECFALEVEPHLCCTVLRDFPPELAALSRVEGGYAQRFEVFYEGIELANGYHELIDPTEQRERLERNNQERLALGTGPYPVDPFFLEALERGLPDCCGVAVGFDRLMMVRHGVRTIAEILPFAWEVA